MNENYYPDKFRFSASADLTPQEESRLIADLEKPSKFIDDQLLEKEEKNLSVLADNQIKWYKYKLGIDVSDRFRGINKRVFILDLNKRKVARTKRRAYRKHEDVGGLTHWNNEIVVFKEDHNQFLGRLNHELIHQAARQTDKLSSKDKGTDENGRFFDVTPTLRGYQKAGKKRTLSGFDEGVVETMNLEQLSALSKDPTYINILNNYSPGHIREVLLFDLLTSEIAKKTGLSIDEVKNELYRGEIYGHMKTLKLIADTFGKAALKILAQHQYGNRAEILNIVAQLHLDHEYTEKLLALERGRKIKLNSGIEIKIHGTAIEGIENDFKNLDGLYKIMLEDPHVRTAQLTPTRAQFKQYLSTIKTGLSYASEKIGETAVPKKIIYASSTATKRRLYGYQEETDAGVLTWLEIARGCEIIGKNSTTGFEETLMHSIEIALMRFNAEMNQTGVISKYTNQKERAEFIAQAIKDLKLEKNNKNKATA